MKVRIYYELQDGSFDCVVLTGVDDDEIRQKAYTELNRRNAIDTWSEVLEEQIISMTVKELINKLECFPEDSKVCKFELDESCVEGISDIFWVEEVFTDKQPKGTVGVC